MLLSLSECSHLKYTSPRCCNDVGDLNLFSAFALSSLTRGTSGDSLLYREMSRSDRGYGQQLAAPSPTNSHEPAYRIKCNVRKQINVSVKSKALWADSCTPAGGVPAYLSRICALSGPMPTMLTWQPTSSSSLAIYFLHFSGSSSKLLHFDTSSVKPSNSSYTGVQPSSSSRVAGKCSVTVPSGFL